jgi:cation:H+ antiporter
MRIDAKVLGFDVGTFIVAYGIAIGAAFLPLAPVWPKWIVAVVLLGIHAWYVKRHFDAESHGEAEELAPLRFRRLDWRAHRTGLTEPRLRVVNLQVLAALGLIVIGATFFVGAVEHLGETLGVAPVLLALVLAPIATELPEKFNSIIWVRQGKDTLAMGNITGAMVFQSTIPTVIALLFASSAWSVGDSGEVAFLSAGIGLLSSIVIFVPMARRGRLRGRGLLVGGAFYVAYLVYVLAVVVNQPA